MLQICMQSLHAVASCRLCVQMANACMEAFESSCGSCCLTSANCASTFLRSKLCEQFWPRLKPTACTACMVCMQNLHADHAGSVCRLCMQSVTGIFAARHWKWRWKCARDRGPVFSCLLFSLLWHSVSLPLYHVKNINDQIVKKVTLHLTQMSAVLSNQVMSLLSTLPWIGLRTQ